MASPANEVEIRVVGLSRSGNHAIIDWLLAQMRGRTCLLNCAEPRTNPFVTARPLGEHEPGHRVNFDGFDLDGERHGRFSHKDYLVHTYEDTFLAAFGDPFHEAKHDEWVGRSRRRFDLLVLRDPYNLLASRLTCGFGVAAPIAVRIWCRHAREFLGLDRHLRDERVLVSYNAWASSRSYRRRVAEQLELEFDDRAAAHVPACAGGSSFDGHGVSPCRMALHDRWRGYTGRPDYRSVLTPELHDLAQRIFGPLEAAEACRS